jgi:MFS family permease
MCWVYFLQFMDKQTLNLANAYTLQTDLNLQGRDYSWVASITNIGYLVCAYPVTILLQKLPIGKFVSVMVMVWGAILMLMCTVNNFAGIAAFRFLLGGAESCIGPAWMLLTTIFWTREEAPLRMSFWLGMNGLSALASAGIGTGLGSIPHPPLPVWKLIFLVCMPQRYRSRNSIHWLTRRRLQGYRDHQFRLGGFPCVDYPFITQ